MTTEEMTRAQRHFADHVLSWWSEDGTRRVWPVLRDNSPEPFDVVTVAECDTPEAAACLAAWLSSPTLWDVAGEV